jgi:hypothetical protein
MSDKPEQPAIVSEVVARPSGKTIKSEMIEKIQIKEKTMKTNVKLSIASILLLSVGLLVSACAGPVEPTAAPSSVGEVQQDSQVCMSDCSGVQGGIGFTKTCTSSCTATNTGITCDGTFFACQQACSPLEGHSCGTPLRCACATFPRHYDCDGVCVPDDDCSSCCGRFLC